MSLIKWNDYKEEILSLKEQGKGSRKIADILSSKYDINVESANIRQFLRRWNYQKSNPSSNRVKILLFDLETSHIHARVWGKWQQNINDDDIIKDWIILCWSAKWLFDDTIYSAKLNKKEIKKWDDNRIVKMLWNLLDEADIIIAHNLMGFDRKKSNARFLYHRLGLPSPYQTIDTLLVARKQFKITSNKLDYLGEILGVGRKISTESGLWNKVEDGDMEAMDKMSKYCDGDVQLLEDVYLELRPYIQPSPNIGLFSDSSKPVCTSCGSEDIRENGEYVTTVHSYQNFTCNNCGSHSRGRKTLLLREKSSVVLSSNPK